MADFLRIPLLAAVAVALLLTSFYARPASAGGVDASGLWSLSLTHPDAQGPIPCTAVFLQLDSSLTGEVVCAGFGADEVAGTIDASTGMFTVEGQEMRITGTVSKDGSGMSGSWVPLFLGIPGGMSGNKIPVPAGDANCDLAVDSVDALAVLQLHVGLVAGLPCASAADVNADGEVDSIDALLILQQEAGLA